MNRMDEGLAFLLQYENIAWYEKGEVKILDEEFIKKNSLCDLQNIISRSEAGDSGYGNTECRTIYSRRNGKWHLPPMK